MGLSGATVLKQNGLSLGSENLKGEPNHIRALRDISARN
jgi:hypothetical protein